VTGWCPLGWDAEYLGVRLQHTNAEQPLSPNLAYDDAGGDLEPPRCPAFLEREPGRRTERMPGKGRRLPVAMDRIVEAAAATALAEP
jgi:hypothetical protein